MENLYCTIFIVDVSQNPEEVDTVTSRIVQLIEDHGGVIKRQEPWGKRRLAYSIHNRTSGFYVEIEFTAKSRLNIPNIIEQEYRLNDRVLRYLTYVVTKKELLQRKLDATRVTEEEDEKPRGGRPQRGEKREERKPQPAEKEKPAPVEAKPKEEITETETQASDESKESEARESQEKTEEKDTVSNKTEQDRGKENVETKSKQE